MFGEYRNNGSKCKNIETSLISLLNKEDTYVSRLNECYRAIEIAKRTDLRTAEYEKDIKSTMEKLKECREEIKDYFKNKIYE